MSSQIRVLVVDDHAVLREGLRAMLESAEDIVVIGEASSGDEALAGLTELVPDVMLLDVRMPGKDGLSTLAEVRQVCPDLAVLILSMYDDPAYVEEAITQGANGYLLKTIPCEELIRAVRAVNSGHGYLQAAITPHVLSRFARTDLRTSDISLSPREREILQQIANGHANKQIADDLGIADATVKTHIRSLFEKLGASHRAHAVALALRERLID